jgi:hypothetical protein
LKQSPVPRPVPRQQQQPAAAAGSFSSFLPWQCFVAEPRDEMKMLKTIVDSSRGDNNND